MARQIKDNLISINKNENFIQTWGPAMRWKHVSQKYYANIVSDAFCTHWCGRCEADKGNPFHKVGTKEFKPPELLAFKL